MNIKLPTVTHKAQISANILLVFCFCVSAFFHLIKKYKSIGINSKSSKTNIKNLEALIISFGISKIYVKKGIKVYRILIGFSNIKL
jgi:hypothetical protein